METWGMVAALLAAGAIGGGAAVAGWELTDADPETARAGRKCRHRRRDAGATGGSGLSVAEIYRRTSAGVVLVRRPRRRAASRPAVRQQARAS